MVDGQASQLICPISGEEAEFFKVKADPKQTAAPDMYDALKRDELLANVAILATPSGPKRNKLTEINILRMKALAKAENK